MQKKKIDPKVLKTIILFAVIETVITAVLVTADILTKHYAFLNIPSTGDIEYLGGFLTITVVKNTGASFGIFGTSTVALTIVSFVCSLLVYGFAIYTERTRTPLLRAALVFVLAGAIGNLIDRFFLGYVRDMIQLSIFPWVFNVADTYLTIGVILLLIYVIFFYTRDKERADKRKAVQPANGGVPTAEGLRVAEEEEDAENEASAPDTETNPVTQTSTNAVVFSENIPEAEAETTSEAKLEKKTEIASEAEAANAPKQPSASKKSKPKTALQEQTSDNADRASNPKQPPKSKKSKPITVTSDPKTDDTEGVSHP